MSSAWELASFGTIASRVTAVCTELLTLAASQVAYAGKAPLSVCNYEQTCLFVERIVLLKWSRSRTRKSRGPLSYSTVTTGAVLSAEMGNKAMAAIGNMSARPRVRLLVVDDDASIREVSAAMLTDEGYEVLTVEDGIHALEVLPRFCPDLVITDLRMPRMSGFELLKILRERFPRLPAIAVSGEFCGDELPPDVIADAFVPKGGVSYMTTLGTRITELLLRHLLSSDPGCKAGSHSQHNDSPGAEVRLRIRLLRST